MEKERRKNDILSSLDGLKRAEPGPEVYAGIRAKIDKAFVGSGLQVVRGPYLALAAASLVLLITANIWALNRQQTETTASSVYQVDNAHFDLY